jgi:hypothetical protein
MFSDKCLKKWYHLRGRAIDRRIPSSGSWVPTACLEGEIADIGKAGIA